MKSILLPNYRRVQFLLAVTLCAATLPEAWAQFPGGPIAPVAQGNTTYGNAAGCAPTAAANGLIYLDDNYYSANDSLIPNLILGGGTPDGIATANQLSVNMGTTANGTAPANRDAGIANYLAAQGTPVAVVGGQAPRALGVTTANVLQQSPTASYMAQELAAGDAVEFGQYWGSQAQEAADTSGFGASGNGLGGHVLTLLAITSAAGGQSGTISFEDPTGPGYVASVGWTLLANGLIFVSGDAADPVPVDPNAGMDQGGNTYNSFAISDDVVESVVPEPPTIMAGLAALGMVTVSLARRRAQNRVI